VECGAKAGEFMVEREAEHKNEMRMLYKHSVDYRYNLVHTSTYQYIPVHTSTLVRTGMYWYVQACTGIY
jgi:hypothetical protein